MDKLRLNLKHSIAVRDDELFNRMHEALFERFVRRDMNIGVATSIQDLVGQPGALAQDAFSALIIRQGGGEEALQPLGGHIGKLKKGRRVDHEGAVS